MDGEGNVDISQYTGQGRLYAEINISGKTSVVSVSKKMN